MQASLPQALRYARPLVILALRPFAPLLSRPCCQGAICRPKTAKRDSTVIEVPFLPHVWWRWGLDLLSVCIVVCMPLLHPKSWPRAPQQGKIPVQLGVHIQTIHCWGCCRGLRSFWSNPVVAVALVLIRSCCRCRG